jgi:hypothetical protein
MKLIGPDIPELKNKNWQQRRVLYKQARDRDKRIWIRSIFANLICVPVFCLVMALLKNGYLPSFVWALVAYVAIGFPLALVLNRWWVDPLVKNAIQTLLAQERENKPLEVMH